MGPYKFYEEWLRRAFRGQLLWAEGLSGLAALASIPIGFYWQTPESAMNWTPFLVFGVAFIGTVLVGLIVALVGAALKRVNSNGSLVATTVATCATTNLVTADQFIAITIPGGMYREEFEKRGLSLLNLSRTLEDSATLTSALIPWNTCGAYMSATLGIATVAYAPYAFFNYLCPIIAVIYGYWNIAQKPLETGDGVAVPA